MLMSNPTERQRVILKLTSSAKPATMTRRREFFHGSKQSGMAFEASSFDNRQNVKTKTYQWRYLPGMLRTSEQMTDSLELNLAANHFGEFSMRTQY